MKNLQDIIKKAEEEYRKKLGNPNVECGDDIPADAWVSGYFTALKKSESFLPFAIREAIEKAFKETEVENESFEGDVFVKFVEGYNDALAEVKRKQEEFLEK